MTPKPSIEHVSLVDKLRKALLLEPKSISELLGILRDAQKQKLLHVDALGMIEGVLNVSEMRVNEVMVPRTQMITIPKDGTLDEILSIVIGSGHSRFPVIGEKKDEVIGILLAKDLLPFLTSPSAREKFSLRELLRNTIFIPESKRLDVLLNEFRKSRNHMAVVVDEYGGITGMLTIEDVLEQIVGDIEDEHDYDDDSTIRKHSEHRYTIKASTPITEFNDFFNAKLEHEEFDTMGGLIMNRFGHLPKRGEQISIDKYLFTVIRSDNRRIYLLRMVIE